MKKIKIVIIILVISFFLFLTYLNSMSFIGSKTWKHNEGFSIGDIIDFYHFKNNGKIIYEDSKPRAKIVFCYWKGLFIKSIETGEIGRYEKKEFKRQTIK